VKAAKAVTGGGYRGGGAYDLLDEVLVFGRTASADADQRLCGSRDGGLVLGVNPRQYGNSSLAPERTHLHNFTHLVTFQCFEFNLIIDN
jgi:hypothetical protein